MALPRLRGVALFDHLEAGKVDVAPVEGLMWKRREIESYVCSRFTLEMYAAASAEGEAPDPLFEPTEVEKRVDAMREAIEEIESALKSLGRGSPWDGGVKTSDEFLDPLFRAWFRKLGLPDVMAKKSFHELVEHIPFSKIDPEIREKLDAIVRVAGNGAAEFD